jgi:hypothetical protein
MFPSTNDNRQHTPRLIGALRLIRSFLLLEDGYDVDWEVDQDERGSERGVADGPFAARPGRGWQRRGSAEGEHPHRRAMRMERRERERGRERRPGSVQEREQACVCSLPATPKRRPPTPTPANQSN